MKNKPTKHKETNTFKFKPFSERVNEIDIDVFHKVAHRNEVDSEESDTYFYQCLQKWKFENLTGNYCNFRKDVKDIVTLEQLLYHKKHVIEILLKYLRLKDPLCLQPIFEALIAVAKDLQYEFYDDYFPQFLSVIIDLLHTKDADQLEYCFTTLAYLFKFLRKYMVKNIDKVFNLLVPLLADTKSKYLNNFAAESFAFVVRNVKNKEAFFRQIITSLERNVNENETEKKNKKKNILEKNDRKFGVEGCGKLLFYVCVGVPGQFHSCAENVLSVYLTALKDTSLNQELVVDVLSTIFDCINNEIHPQNCDVLWTVLYNMIDKLPHSCLISLFKLVQQIINYKNGQMIKDTEILSKKLVELLDKYQNSEYLLKEITEMIVATLLATKAKFLQEHLNLLITKLLLVLSIKDENFLFKITEKLISCSFFETMILPHIMRKINSSSLNTQSLQLLTKIIEIKSPPRLNGINFDKWQKFSLKINSDNYSFLLQILNSLDECEIMEETLNSLIVLPHLSILPTIIIDKLKERFMYMLKYLAQNDASNNIDNKKIGYLFLLLSDSLIHIIAPDDFHNLISENHSADFDLFSTLLKYKDDISMLNILDLCLSFFNNSCHFETYINQTNFDKIHQSLAPKLGSPYSQVRLTTAHLFSLFSTLPFVTEKIDDPKAKFALELPYLAELEPVTVHNYRVRLIHIQALDFNGVAVSHMNKKYLDCPLHYLFGNLYLNFSLMWEPVCKIIASYATKESSNIKEKNSKFWEVFLEKLKSQAENDENFYPTFEDKMLNKIVEKLFGEKEKIDYINFKLLLWRIAGMIAPYCEVKNKDFVGLFIDFVESYFKLNSEYAKSCNIKKRNSVIDAHKINEKKDDKFEGKEDSEVDEILKENKKIDQNSKEVEMKEENEEDEDEEDEENTDLKLSLSRIDRTKLLLAMLQVFSKFTNVRSLYREPEILKIYQDLISSKNSELQKAALACLYTYKYNYLLPYKIQLDNIVDEKNFKNELVRFQISVDEENKIVLEEHRNGLIPVLMRILHAKMTQKMGMRTGGKAGGLVRRKIIMRFLAGVKEEEMMIFVRMAFKPFKDYLPILKIEESNQTNINLKELVNDIFNSIDLENVIPPKRMQSAVNLLAIIIEQFGGKMVQKLLPHLLAILICMLAQISGILHKSTEVHTGYLSSIRNVRNSCINALARFFVHYEKYDWRSDEIDALFLVAVWPSINKLPIEGIHSPTPLLKMLSAWSQNPRYYSLFVKLDKNNETPILFVIKLLINQKTHKSVSNMILDMIEKMLIFQDFEKEDPDQMDVDEEKAKSLLPVVTNKLDIVTSDIINYGSSILLPHVTSILTYLEGKIKRNPKRGVSRTELIILSRISEFATDASICDTLLTLILPILCKKANESEERVIQLISTVTNLVQNVNEPARHLRSMLSLLARINSTPARKMLMKLYDATAAKDENLRENQKVITELNAFDQRWIDQPDFQRRLNAFVQIDEMIKDDKVSMEFGVSVILNCFYFLKFENDLAMRDRSGQCLKIMGVYLAKKFKDSSADRKYLIEEIILTNIRFGIRSTHETLYLQSIAFLGHMSLECADVHPILRDLSILADKQNPDVDFFENMQHLQLHRRGKAFQKFCKIAKTMTKAPSPKTLTQFILPLASSYLFNEKYASKNSMVDDAIATVGMVCRLLPWHQYEIVLLHYLDKLTTGLEYQKQAVRIIVAILDAFHFDLSKYKGDIENDLKVLANQNIKNKRITLDKSSDEKEIELTENMEDTVEPKESEEVANENLVEALNDESVVEEIKTEEELEENGELNKIEDAQIPIIEKKIILSPYMAKRLIFNVSKGLIPQLHKSIASRMQHEGAHKGNKKRVSKELEEEELMRVPIALAMVKLLQKMPEKILDTNVRGIFSKVCTFLKSRLESVRRTTREILQQIMIALGPNYLHHLLKEMNALLTRGFQVHVLAFTIHAILSSLKPYFTDKHMKENLSMILSVCKIDLFGPSAEEKEIGGIIKNVSEAKSTKSFDIFNILGEFIDEDSIINVVMPLREMLTRTRSHKVVRKITDSLRQLGLGLVNNKFIDIKKIVEFLHGIASESIPELTPHNEKKQAEKEKKKSKLLCEKTDIFLIVPPPKNRMGERCGAKTSQNTNDNVMIEFSLKLLHILLKRDKLNDPELKALLDPFVPILNNCLKSQHVTLSTLALQCLGWILRIDLPLVRSLVSEICDSIFAILHKYAAPGLTKGENFDLVMAAFKTMSVLVRDVKHFVITKDHLKALLLYAEQDLHDSERQATAFGSLRAIIHRKLEVPEMKAVMDKVKTLIITSENENVKKQARAVFFTYLHEYPVGMKNIKGEVDFLLNQLTYELTPGRISVLAMIESIIIGFPPEVICRWCQGMFYFLGKRLINDTDTDCQRESGKCIEELLMRLPLTKKNELFSTWEKGVIPLLKDEKRLNRILSIELCRRFVIVEKDEFEPRLNKLLPLLIKQFYATKNFDEENQPGRFVKLNKDDDEEENKDPEKLIQFHFLKVLTLIKEISENCAAFLKDKKYRDTVNSIGEYCESFLPSAHLMVRIAATQLLGNIFSTLDVEKIIKLMDNPEDCDPDDGYVYSNPAYKLEALAKYFIELISLGYDSQELYDATAKNLVFISKTLKITKSSQKDENDKKDNHLSLLWLLKELRFCINKEVSQAPTQIIIRSTVFKCMGGIVASIEMDKLKPVLFHIISPLVREMVTTEVSNAPLRQLAKEVATMIKKKMEPEEYTRLISQAQQKLDTRRTERKKVKQQQFVTEPEIAAKKKIARQQRKKESRKRKVQNFKEKKGFRKKVKKDIELDF